MEHQTTPAAEKSFKSRIHISLKEESSNGEKSQKVIIVENYKGWIVVTLAIIVALIVLGFVYLKGA